MPRLAVRHHAAEALETAAVDEPDRAASSLDPSSRTWACIPSMAMKRDGGPAEILNADAFFSSRSSDSCLFGVWQRRRPRPVDNKQHSCSTRRRLESSVPPRPPQRQDTPGLCRASGFPRGLHELRNRPAAKRCQSSPLASSFGAGPMAGTGFSLGSILAEWLTVEYQPSSRSAWGKLAGMSGIPHRVMAPACASW